jgi:hypothetical protein
LPRLSIVSPKIEPDSSQIVLPIYKLFVIYKSDDFVVGKRKPKLKRLVLDVLKPHIPTLPDFTMKLSSIPGVDGVDVTLIEIDKDTDTLKVTIEGDLDYNNIRSVIEERGGVVHSVDEVSAGVIAVDEAPSAEHRFKLRTHEGKG